MKSPLSLYLPLAAAALLVLATACSSGGPATSRLPVSNQPSAGGRQNLTSPAVAPPAGQSLDACSLLSDAEIQQVTERSIASKDAGSVQGIFENGCSWELDPGRDDVVGWTIDIGVISPGGRRYFDTFLSFPEDTEPVPGLGDIAVRSDVGGISAVKGDTLVSVFVIAFSADDEDELTRELTQTALSHVP